MTAPRRFVVFPIGKKRFALPAEEVAELAKPDLLQVFPHTTSLMTGVLVRRGVIIPVCDIAQVLVGTSAPPRRFYLIATQVVGRNRNLVALPVSGECELSFIEPRQQTGRLPDYVESLIALDDEIIEVLSLSILMSDDSIRTAAVGGHA